MNERKLLWRTKGKEIELPTETDWYHGGPGGLKIGDYLQPNQKTGLVFITPCLVTAQAYAAAVRIHQKLLRCSAKYPYIRPLEGPPHKSGAVYRVAPSLPIEPDPASPRVQFSCPNARIIEVVKFDLRVDIPLWKIIAKYMIPGYAGKQVEFPTIT
jgi:hypothetical protein